MFPQCLFLIVLALSIPIHGQVGHGPIVHWNQDPTKACDVVWLERSGAAGIEGKWSFGPAGFGYGDDDDATVFSQMKNRYQSLAIRRELKLPPEVPADAVLILRVDYDDAFVAWLDGKEIARKNMRGTGKDSSVASSHNAGQAEDIRLGRVDRFLGSTSSILAVQGFNVKLDSSDFSLHPRIIAKSGRKEWTLIAPGADWQYLANANPEIDWQKKLANLPAAENRSGLVNQPFTLRYRAKGDPAWIAATVKSSPFAASKHKVFRATLPQLPAGRDIEFQIDRAAVPASETHVFRMPPAQRSAIRFVAGGDVFHEREPMDRMNQRAGKEDPLFALIGGDLAYANNENIERWFDYIDSWAANSRTSDGRLLPKVVAIGNHEIIGAGYHPVDAPGPEAASMFYSLFQFPGGNYATHCVDFGEWISFVMLDSGHTRNVTAQNEWLEKSLSARARVPHVFVCYHRPAWGIGAKPDAVEIQRAWCPLFERHRVTAVFENDHHVFSRSHPLKAGAIDHKNGIPYLGSGSWSVALRQIDPKEVKKRPWIAASGSFNHLYVVDTSENGYTAVAKDIAGREIDRSERVWHRGK